MSQKSKSKLFTENEIRQALKLTSLGFAGKLLTKLIIAASKLNYAGKIYYNSSHHKGIDFLESSLAEMRVSYEVSDEDLKKIPETGAFITVSNHPFGFLDGILLILILGKKRPDFRVMANFLLQKFKTIEEFFIPVDPFEGKNQTANSLKGIKLTLQCLRDGHPVGIFPSGEVSTYYPNQEGIMDKEWQTSALKVIQKSGVPVIPVFFHGTNSKTFHMLGKIHPLLRTTWIVREFYNKRGKNIKISIRDAISPEEIKKFEDVRELGLFLRARTYGLA